jgi:hypothetical protein
MKKVGFFTSFGLGGADNTSYTLTKNLMKHYGNTNFIIFYNDYSLPKQNKPSRYNNYLDYSNPIKIQSVNEFNNYNLDILFVHRGGDELWLLPNFEITSFKFKIIEINFHGALKTKADLRIFPSISLVNYRCINHVPRVIIPNPISYSSTNDNLRIELNLNNKFVVGRVARGDCDIYCDINLKAYKNIEDENTVFLYLNPSQEAITDSKKLNIKNIIFLNPTIDTKHLDTIYNTFDIHVHSNSIGETFGNSIAESFIRGIPTISHDGFHNWPQAHKEFYITTPDMYINKEEKDIMISKYTIILNKLKTDLKYRISIAKQQQEYAKSNFSDNIVINKYIQLIESM